MKAAPFKGTPAPSMAGLNPSDTITRAQLVALIASKVKRKKGDDEAVLRNRIASMVTYDVRHRKLRCVERGKFLLGDVAIWTCGRWPGGEFLDVPTFPITGSAALALSGVSGNAEGYTRATTLAEADSQILALRLENRSLKQERDALADKVQRLEAEVRRYLPGYLKRTTKGKGSGRSS